MQFVQKTSSAILSFFAFNSLDEKTITTSWFISRSALLGYRCLVAVYAFIVSISVISNSAVQGGSQRTFVYFTNLTYFGITGYFIAAAIYTILAERDVRRADRNMQCDSTDSSAMEKGGVEPNVHSMRQVRIDQHEASRSLTDAISASTTLTAKRQSGTNMSDPIKGSSDASQTQDVRPRKRFIAQWILYETVSA